MHCLIIFENDLLVILMSKNSMTCQYSACKSIGFGIEKPISVSGNCEFTVQNYSSLIKIILGHQKLVFSFRLTLTGRT